MSRLGALIVILLAAVAYARSLLEERSTAVGDRAAVVDVARPPVPSPQGSGPARRTSPEWMMSDRSGAGGTGTARAAQESKLDLLRSLDPNQIVRPERNVLAPDVFNAVEPPPPPPPSAPPAPKATPKAPAIQIATASLPAASNVPSVPFRFMGRYEAAEERRVFLASTTEAFNAREGDVLPGQWQVLRILPDRIELKFLPLDAPLTMVIP